jgi:hypothetical protein
VAQENKKFRKLGQQLLEHMEKGYSFTSFSAVVGIPKSTMSDWADKNPIFKKFKELGEAKSQHYWETIGIAASQGNLRRVTKETVKRTTIYDDQGNPQLGGDGKPAVKEEVVAREYESISLPQAAYIFTMKARFGLRDDGQGPALDGTGGLRTFQLAYSLKDQPYVVRSKSSEPAATAGASSEQPKPKEKVNGDATQQSIAPTAGNPSGHPPEA